MSTLPHAALSHAPPASAVGARFLSRYSREISVAIAYGLLLLLLAAFRPAFFQPQAQALETSQSRFKETLVSAAPLLIAAVGMTLVIIARHIDISIGAQFSVCGMVAGTLAVHDVPIPGIIAGTLLAGAAMGAVNGALVAGLGMPSIVVTLATLVIIRGALTWLTQGEQIQLPLWFQWFGTRQHVGQWLIIATALVVFVIFALMLRWLSAGRAVFAVGSDQEAARLAGIRPRRVVFFVFVQMGVLTALAALIGATKLRQIEPGVGKGMELAVIAAVVVGGTAITGGRGTLIGTLIGVALLETISPALGYLSAPAGAGTPKWMLVAKIFGLSIYRPSQFGGPQWTVAIQGLIILLAVMTDGLRRREN